MSRVTERLLALSSRKYQESTSESSAVACRPCSPVPGRSTLTTSAPSHANVSVHDVPASNWVRSMTRTPARAGRPLDSLGCTWPVYERRRELEEGLATP